MAMENNNILEVNDLAVSFQTTLGQVKAVRGVSFDLKRGETLAIVGESGSGKSVTTKTVMRLLDESTIIEKGQIRFNGKDILNCTEKEMESIRGQQIGMIFQDPLSALNPVMRIGNQITECLIFRQKMSRKEAKKVALKLIEQVGIDHPEQRFKQYPFQFSGGMRQRIVIAIALAQNPELLICDEPTTALDVTIQAQVLELIKDLQKKRNLSVIFITHDMGVVANVADKVCVMYAGKIVEYGTAEEVFFDPRHPYTWSLMASLPDMDTAQGDQLIVIPGTPPNMLYPPKGDAFARRNRYAMRIDFKEEPPMFKVTDTHYAATWLLHPDAPACEMPEALKRRIEKQKLIGGIQ